MTFSLVSSLISTNGNLTVGLHMPSNEAAYLTGEGLLSIKSDEWSGCSNLSNSEALLIFWVQAFWKSEESFAAHLL